MRSRSHWKVLDDPRGAKIVAWLRKAPVPHRLVAEDADGNEISVAVKNEHTKVKWTDVTTAVIHCIKIVGLNEKGDIVRQLDLDAPEDENALELAQQRREAARAADDRIPGREPIISVDVPKLVQSIAEAMKDVAQTASNQQAAAYTAGMNSMVSVVNLCLTMLQRVDERLADREDEAAELEQQRQQLLIETTAQNAPPSMRDQLMQAAIAKALGGGGGNDNGNGGGVDPSMVMKLTSLFQQFQQQSGANTPPPEGSA
jgi:hypothetical protein